MAENSKIEWTHHTFNPWRGCTKVSAGCANCYAETLSKRNPATLGIWGDNGTRVVAAESYWKQPLKWNKQVFDDAPLYGEKRRKRVFCASLADVFEDRPELIDPRSRLLQLTAETPNLDWLLLTKRPENIFRLLESSVANRPWVRDWINGSPPANVWLGTTVENQEQADKRIPELLKIPAAVRFLSCEPLLGPVDLSKWMNYESEADDLGLTCAGFDPDFHWVICGGESGANARPMNLGWARRLRDQCKAANIAFHFKQHGEWLASEQGKVPQVPVGTRLHFFDNGIFLSIKVGKEKAGRVLDGRTWDEVPGGQR